MSTLFTPGAVGKLRTPNRVVMAPMTRSRSTQPGDVSNAMNVVYYAQCASAAFIVTETTQTCTGSPTARYQSMTGV